VLICGFFSIGLVKDVIQSEISDRYQKRRSQERGYDAVKTVLIITQSDPVLDNEIKSRCQQVAYQQSGKKNRHDSCELHCCLVLRFECEECIREIRKYRCRNERYRVRDERRPARG